jgi:hypothetical protein
LSGIPTPRIYEYNTCSLRFCRGTLVDDHEKYQHCANKFIRLANELKDEKIDPAMVSGALMMASSVYATFLAAGNSGALEPSGVDKVVAVYRRTLEELQAKKKTQLVNKKFGE